MRVPELMTAVAGAAMPAVALTDETNLFAMVKFYRAALAKGVKPLIGVDLAMPSERDESHRISLLCQNEAGYLNLSRLVSRAYLEGQRQELPLIEREWLTPESTAGLIALSGAMDGDVGNLLLLGRPGEARRRLESWIALFGDRYYLELQRIGRPQESEYITAA
ncbi:MAG: PHP domain-containing protein, partial [Steroidobacteraceae bacterium]